MLWRILLTAAAFVLSLAAVGFAAFFAVLVLAGPHSAYASGASGVAVVAIAWLLVLFVPALLARLVWRRSGEWLRSPQVEVR
jgi:hypothetical protein